MKQNDLPYFGMVYPQLLKLLIIFGAIGAERRVKGGALFHISDAPVSLLWVERGKNVLFSCTLTEKKSFVNRNRNCYF